MIIGLSQRILYHKGRAYDSIEHGWYSFLRGHTLFFIPNDIEQNLDSIADNLDAFIITGGDDSYLRRITELRLSAKMMARNKPTIGICHGAFLITDLLGGKVEPVISHMDCSHTVYYFGEPVLVNSYHNLGIKELHSTATELVVDPEGHCEAWIDKNLAGIVWHPERMTNAVLPNDLRSFLQ